MSPIQPLERNKMIDTINKNKHLQEQLLGISLSEQSSLIKVFLKHPQGPMNENEELNFGGNDSSDLNVYTLEKQKKKEYNKNDGAQKSSDFDITAKEIAQQKKLYNVDKPRALVTERPSPNQQQSTSRAETVKWTFSKKDSQETQKKISVMNRDESSNAGQPQNRSLKSYNSSNSMPEIFSFRNNQGSIKGKMLDFENANSDLLNSGIFLLKSKRSSNERIYDEDQAMKRANQKLISYLEEDEILDQLASSQSQNQGVFVFKGLIKQREALSNTLKSLLDNTLDCQLCNDQKIFDESLQVSKIEQTKTRMQIMQENLDRKYLTSREYYNVKIINDIIYNECTHIVSVFKDYLIFDDISEFLKRFYNNQESLQRLPKMFEYYEKFSKIFANYVILPENKYMFKNIQKKQRIYDERQRILQQQQDRANGLGESQINKRHRDRFSSSQQNTSFMSQLSNKKIFNTNFIESVLNIQPSGIIDSLLSSRIFNSQYQEHMHNSSIIIQNALKENVQNAEEKIQQKRKNIEEMGMDELISKFIAKDSDPSFQQSSILALSQERVKPQPQTKEVYEYIPCQQLPENSKQEEQKNQKQSTQKDQKMFSGIRNEESRNRGFQDQQALREGQMVSYNIYNNYNQYISNENYYINTEDRRENDQQPAKENAKQDVEGLKRTQSKPNLHKRNSNKEKSLSPSKNIIQKDKTPPQSIQSQKAKDQNFKVLKKDVEYFAQTTEDQRQMLQNQSTSTFYKMDPNSSPVQVMSKVKINNNALSLDINQLGTQDINSRDQSRDRSKQIIVNTIIQPVLSASSQNANHMFNHKNIRSVERLKQIEDEIEKDFSKYVNDYGLSKTAFAKAVNSLREKQSNKQQYCESSLTERCRKTTSQCSNENPKKLVIINKRLGSASQPQRMNTNRQDSAAKVLLSSGLKQLKMNDKQKQRNENYFDMNILRQDQNKPIRSIRTKKHISSKNSSSYFQKSQKQMSPDQNCLINSLGQVNQLAFNQSTNPLQIASQGPNYITLKTQPGKNSKSIKIKFPLKTQREVSSLNQNQSNSNNQTPKKRTKLKKIKSTSTLLNTDKICIQANNNNIINLRPKASDVQVLDEMGSYLNNGVYPSNPQLPRNMNPFVGQSQVLSHISEAMNSENNTYANFNPQQTFQSCSGGGTYATTSILNSPLSFKDKTQKNSNNTKLTSRNSSTQNQSHKSSSVHQRVVSMSSNVIKRSNQKVKAKESKRLSAGTNLQKKFFKPLINHQQSSSTAQQQLIQLLMSNQSDHEDVLNSQTFKNLSTRSNNFSSKDLKSIKSATSKLLKDIQLVKPKNPIKISQGALISKVPNLLTSRLGHSQSCTVLKQQNSKKVSNSGKNTNRVDSKKRMSVQLHKNATNEGQNQFSQMNQMKATNNQEVSSKFSTIPIADHSGQNTKRMLLASRSQENFDLIKFAAQRALEQNQNQQTIQVNNQPKFLQNVQQQDNQQLIQKIRFLNSQQQSARNQQYDIYQQPIQGRASDQENYNQNIKIPTTIIFSKLQIDKSQSRRTSEKLQPSKN